jgi:hypothetical protein
MGHWLLSFRFAQKEVLLNLTSGWESNFWEKKTPLHRVRGRGLAS